MNSRYLRFLLPLAFFGLSVFQCRSQNYTVGDYSDWLNNGSQYLTGFGIDPEGGDTSIGQTFQINNGNALVSSISGPIFNNTPSVQYQVGVAVWNGTQPTGSALYLSSAQSATSDGWQSFDVTPDGLTLNQNQEYILYVTPVDSSPSFNAGVGYVPSGDYSPWQAYTVIGQLDPDNPSTQTWNPDSVSMAFTIDYQVVPEPGIFALLCLGSLALWLRNRI